MKSIFDVPALQMELTPGKVVRAFRLKLGLSHSELAEITGIKATNISRIENDRSGEITTGTARKLATALGLEPDLIMFPRGYRPPKYEYEAAEIEERVQAVLAAKGRE